MENSLSETQIKSQLMTSKSNTLDESISDFDTPRRAYEIYLKYSINFSGELWNMLRSETPIKEFGG
jgi:hypothetical protein